MRNKFCNTLTEKVNESDFIFFTGDLGFMALEPLRDALGNRFINAGIAEQNMVSVSAGMARIGWKPWIYSISPFLYARPYEQIRNDVCLQDLPVRLVGNGGGYGYGAMGATHHALEDYGSLLCLPNMHVFIPAFSDDLPEMITRINSIPHPVYIRLGRCEKPEGFNLPVYSSWRRLVQGNGPTLVVVGPLVGEILRELHTSKMKELPDLWVLSEMPLNSKEMPVAFFNSLDRSKHLMVIEEHCVNGSVGQALVYLLGTMGKVPPRFIHRYARGYTSGLYGSQKFHRRECGLDAASILAWLEGF